jgi:hypothetical protein
MCNLVGSSPYRRRLALHGHAIIGIVLSLVTLSALPAVHIHQLDVHLQSVHYARWVEQNTFAAHAALDSIDRTVQHDARPRFIMPLTLEVEPEPGNDTAIEPPVPLNRFLLRFKLSLRSSCDSDPLLV